MRHTSVPLNSFPCEFINVVPYNPLISHCEIKVCYVDDKPNRNRSVITKEVATELANSIPGSPIVGFYNKEKQDFEGHNQELVIEDGQIKFEATTQPYGFVDLNAKVWFQKFLDDGQVEREYLVTEGWLWTGQYEAAKKAYEEGKGHSMELDEENTSGTWSINDQGKKEFFIINEAIMSKLCILGDDVEPCFEGASLGKEQTQFSFEDSFKEQLFSMMNEIKQILSEGGAKVDKVNETTIIDTVEQSAVEDSDLDFKKKPEDEEEEKKAAEDEAPAKAEDEEDEDEEKKKKFAEDKEEKTCPECGKPIDECTCEEEEEKKTYSLEEYNELQTQYSTLNTAYEALQKQYAELLTFKNSVDKKEKEAMIASFYMLSEADKKDVVDNIDNYSLDEIEAKLSIICVRNKVSFNLDDETSEEEKEPTTYSLEGSYEDDAPAWIKSLRSNQTI